MPVHPLNPFGVGLRSLALALVIALPARAQDTGSSATASEPVLVHIDNFTFGPESLTVVPGTAVTWVNRDDIPHTVVAQDEAFRSKALDTGDRFTFVFDKPGEYPYFCSLHPHMTGKVVVKAPAG